MVSLTKTERPALASPETKLNRLQQILRDMDNVLIAYSGGVDSTFLFRIAHDALGDRAVGVIGKSDSLTGMDYEQALQLASDWGAKTEVIDTEEMSDPNYTGNPSDRCYFCKSELFSKLRVVARQRGIRWIVDGTNYDDLGDHRPGRAAAREKDVRSPLLEAELTKAEIRHLSQALGLPTWDKPEAACLASRIPHGTPVTKQALRQIEDSEAFLRTLGFRQVRVRHHETLARIEVAEEEIELFLDAQRRRQITATLRELGYTHVTVDLAGYRRGSNEGAPASPTLVQIDV